MSASKRMMAAFGCTCSTLAQFVSSVVSRKNMLLFEHYRAFAGMIICLTLTAMAQTNSLPPAKELFVVAAPHLRTESTKVSKPDADQPRVHLSSPTKETDTADLQSQLPGSFSVGTSYKNTDAYLRHHDFGLILPPKPASRDPITRGFDAVFRPEEFRFGRSATFSCTITTAIKRKNPLCLLNPLFLQVTW
jgi:hypothetical protein